MQDIEEIYLEHSKLIYKYLFCLTRNSEIAEELTQETFLCALKEIDKFKGNCKMSTWLCQIAKHLWSREFKKINNSKIISINQVNESVTDKENVEEKIIEMDEKERLYRKIETLPEEIKEVIYLRIIGECSFKEIGEILGKKENWARVTYYRGKEKLKEGDYSEKQ